MLAPALKNARRSVTCPADASRALEPRNSTKLLDAKMKCELHVTSEPFEVPRKFKDAIGTALKMMKPSSGAGPDGIFAEGLQLAHKEATDLIAEIWTACGRLNYTPHQLRHADIIILHKKGDTALPENYRPIALFSHVRKVIDKTVDLLIREAYQFHKFQADFRGRMGTEIFILRAEDAIDSGYHFFACLDLKSSYDRVPRRKLMRRLKKVLSANMCDMMTHLLQPTTFITRGDDSLLQGRLELGVQQGSPSTSSLFNIYID